MHLRNLAGVPLRFFSMELETAAWYVGASLAWVATSLACSTTTPPPRPTDGTVPARLAVEAPAGAEIHVDGIAVGNAPLATPVDADPGPHHLAVILNGYHPYAREVSLERGKTKAVTIDLHSTPQRVGAWVAIGTGAAGMATGIILGVLSVVEHRDAQDFLDGPGDEPLEEDRPEFEAAIAARDDYRLGSGIAAGTGLAVFVVGAFLFAFDNADVPKPPRKVSAVPWVGPGVAGAATTIRF